MDSRVDACHIKHILRCFCGDIRPLVAIPVLRAADYNYPTPEGKAYMMVRFLVDPYCKPQPCPVLNEKAPHTGGVPDHECYEESQGLFPCSRAQMHSGNGEKPYSIVNLMKCPDYTAEYVYINVKVPAGPEGPATETWEHDYPTIKIPSSSLKRFEIMIHQGKALALLVQNLQCVNKHLVETGKEALQGQARLSYINMFAAVKEQWAALYKTMGNMKGEEAAQIEEWLCLGTQRNDVPTPVTRVVGLYVDDTMQGEEESYEGHRFYMCQWHQERLVDEVFVSFSGESGMENDNFV